MKCLARIALTAAAASALASAHVAQADAMLALAPGPAVDQLSNPPSDHELEARGARIGRIDIQVDDVFENTLSLSAPYRVANGLHISTHAETVRQQLLFRSGDPFHRRDTILLAALAGAAAIANVDCPRDLTEFGGSFPFIHLFAHRPDALRHARCFPAAHASSGYALVALYFVLRERSRRASRLGLATGLGLGLIFGIAQQARGAHFLSHDVWSALLVWTVSLSLYTLVFKARLWNCASLHQFQWECNEAGPAAYRLPVGGTADLPHRLGSAAGS